MRYLDLPFSSHRHRFEPFWGGRGGGRKRSNGTEKLNLSSPTRKLFIINERGVRSLSFQDFCWKSEIKHAFIPTSEPPWPRCRNNKFLEKKNPSISFHGFISFAEDILLRHATERSWLRLVPWQGQIEGRKRTPKLRGAWELSWRVTLSIYMRMHRNFLNWFLKVN